MQKAVKMTKPTTAYTYYGYLHEIFAQLYQIYFEDLLQLHILFPFRIQCMIIVLLILVN